MLLPSPCCWRSRSNATLVQTGNVIQEVVVDHTSYRYMSAAQDGGAARCAALCESDAACAAFTFRSADIQWRATHGNRVAVDADNACRLLGRGGVGTHFVPSEMSSAGLCIRRRPFPRTQQHPRCPRRWRLAPPPSPPQQLWLRDVVVSTSAASLHKAPVIGIVGGSISAGMGSGWVPPGLTYGEALSRHAGDRISFRVDGGVQGARVFLAVLCSHVGGVGSASVELRRIPASGGVAVGERIGAALSRVVVKSRWLQQTSQQCIMPVATIGAGAHTMAIEVMPPGGFKGRLTASLARAVDPPSARSPPETAFKIFGIYTSTPLEDSHDPARGHRAPPRLWPRARSCGARHIQLCRDALTRRHVHGHGHGHGHGYGDVL